MSVNFANTFMAHIQKWTFLSVLFVVILVIIDVGGNRVEPNLN